MSVSSGMLSVIVSMMEFGESPFLSVAYDPDQDAYTGVSPCSALSKLERMGFVRVMDVQPAAVGDCATVRLEARSDFLSAFAAGVREFENGRDLYYADYSQHPFAFSCGHQHAAARAKRPSKPYRASAGYMCHGFLDADNGETRFMQGGE